jgi:hypothetical protein
MEQVYGLAKLAGDIQPSIDDICLQLFAFVCKQTHALREQQLVSTV